MLTFEKEITVLYLRGFIREGEMLDDVLDEIERNESSAVIRYSYDNPHDSECMIAECNNRDLGYVDSDCQRFIRPLLKASPDGTVTVKFYEIYREVGHTPVARFTAVIDLENLEKLTPGEAWNFWDYSGRQLLRIGDLSSVDYCAAMLKKYFLNERFMPEEAVDALVEKFGEASRYDMTIETTQHYDDLLFLLESRHRSSCRKYINSLQRHCTLRRVDRIRKKFVDEWWPQFVIGESADRLCRAVTSDIAISGRTLCRETIDEVLSDIEKSLRTLPYDLYIHVDNIEALWSTLYYTHIPKDKFHKLLSALTLRERLRMAIDGKLPFMVTAKTYIQQTNINTETYIKTQHNYYDETR